jgi:hypothetical protein
MSDEIDEEELGDPCVPPELLELHVLLEETGVSPENFKEVFGDAAGETS